MYNFFVKIFSLLVCFISLDCCPGVMINLDEAKEAIIKYHDSGRYDKEVRAAVEDAKEKFGNINFHDSMVVIFDIDETTLSNYKINKELDFGYIAEGWKKWIDEANAPAIVPVKEFYDYLLKKGSRVIFITGRKIIEYEPTKKNLDKAGYAAFDTLITRMKDEYGLDAEKFKSAKRIELTKKGYIIAGTVGDQWSDLVGEYHGIQIKLPNYMYLVK